MSRARAGRSLKLRQPLELELEHVVELEVVVARGAHNSLLPGDVIDTYTLEEHVTPRPSCCVVCSSEPVVGYATCGRAPCVLELGKRQRGRQ